MGLLVTDWFDGKRYEFDDLDAYLRSPFWAVTKHRYRESDRPQVCFVCGVQETQLHHLRYDRLGMELDDLVPLCEWHHYEVEKYIARRADEGFTRADAHLRYREEIRARGIEARRASSLSR